MQEKVTESLETYFQIIRMKELGIIAIYTLIASGHIRIVLLSCTSEAVSQKVEKAPPFFLQL
jgi:hypothetical protein